MKKILSLTLAALMLLSAVPMAMAAWVCPSCGGTSYNKGVDGEPLVHAACQKGTTCADCGKCEYCQKPTHDISQGTTITMVGSQEAAGESYSITVPAELQPGQSGTVSASGNWSSKQTLKVTAPSSVTLSYGSQTMEVDINFAGINQVGNDTAESSATATVAVEDASALFGTWTGHLTYTVEMGAVAEIIRFNVFGDTYQAEKGMTWEQFVNSQYNSGNFRLNGNLVMINIDGDNYPVCTVEGAEYDYYNVNKADVIDATKNYSFNEDF